MPITALRPTLLGALTPALALLLGLPPQEAQALGVGRPTLHSALGKPLDVSIPLALAQGEQLTDSCLRAEVSAGEARVPAGLLQLRLEGEPGQQYIRLQSQARIDEPTLRITLALGCPLRLTREFNVFVDPPDQTAVTPQPLPPVPAVAPAPVAAALPSPQADVASVPSKPRPRAKPRVTGPRLTLDRPEVLAAAPSRPADPPSAPETALTPDLEVQISQLEETVAQLRTELLARQQAEALAASAAIPSPALPVAPAVEPAPTVRSARTSPYRDPMTWVLTLAMSLVAGAAAFYFSRWRDQRARGELAYWRALHAAEGAGLPSAAPVPGMAPPVAATSAALPEDSPHQITRPQPRPMPWPPAPSPEPAALAVPAALPQPQPQPAQVAAVPLLSRELTIADELLDLQQQVDFLQLLGQHEASADLLAARVARGDVGAMPQLLLMELSQQGGDAEVFAEQARQYEQRFGASAPQWAQPLSQGRSLDGCPSVIAHLQVVWADPEAAMRLLQQLLAQGGGPGVPRFELPAYRDLLMLYGVARDVFEAGLRSDEVDLKLPLDSGAGD